MNYISFVVVFLFSSLTFSQSKIDNSFIKYDPSLTCGSEAKKVSSETFDIVWEHENLKEGEYYEKNIVINTPEISNEVPEFNDRAPSGLNVKCKPFIKGAKILSLELIGVEGLPQELIKGKDALKISTNAKDLTAGPGEKVCIKLSGTPGSQVEKKKYDIDFLIKANIKLGFIKSSTKCVIDKGYLNVL